MPIRRTMRVLIFSGRDTRNFGANFNYEVHAGSERREDEVEELEKSDGFLIAS